MIPTPAIHFAYFAALALSLSPTDLTEELAEVRRRINLQLRHYPKGGLLERKE